MEEQEDVSRWVIMYPIYINSKKTLAEGRRIGVSHGCENPTIVEIGDCCSHLKLPFKLEETKAYSRDYMQRGRVRIKLKELGTQALVNPDIPSRKALMLKVAELVPKHPGRRNQASSSSGVGGSSSSTSATGKSARSGRKKK